MRDHTSIIAWQEANAVAKECLRLSRDHWRPHGGAAFQQLLRSSLSAQINIAEGHVFGPGAQFRRHLGIAYGSAVETGELLELLLEADVVPGAVRSTLERCRRSQRLLLGLIKPKP